MQYKYDQGISKDLIRLPSAVSDSDRNFSAVVRIPLTQVSNSASYLVSWTSSKDNGRGEGVGWVDDQRKCSGQGARNHRFRDMYALPGDAGTSRAPTQRSIRAYRTETDAPLCPHARHAGRFNWIVRQITQWRIMPARAGLYVCTWNRTHVYRHANTTPIGARAHPLAHLSYPIVLILFHPYAVSAPHAQPFTRHYHHRRCRTDAGMQLRGLLWPSE